MFGECRMLELHVAVQVLLACEGLVAVFAFHCGAVEFNCLFQCFCGHTAFHLLTLPIFANHRRIKYDSSFAIDSKQRRKGKILAKHPTTLHAAGTKPRQLKTFSVQGFYKINLEVMETSMFFCIKSHPHFTQIKL